MTPRCSSIQRSFSTRLPSSRGSKQLVKQTKPFGDEDMAGDKVNVTGRADSAHGTSLSPASSAEISKPSHGFDRPCGATHALHGTRSSCLGAHGRRPSCHGAHGMDMLDISGLLYSARLSTRSVRSNVPIHRHCRLLNDILSRQPQTIVEAIGNALQAYRRGSGPYRHTPDCLRRRRGSQRLGPACGDAHTRSTSQRLNQRVTPSERQRRGDSQIEQVP